jgi:hypothetical protein
MEDYANPDQIRAAFFETLQQEQRAELAYETLWRNLREAGWRIRGASPKKQRDTVYNALSTDHRLTKVRPGVFAPRPK